MTVGELKEKLDKLPAEALVWFHVEEDDGMRTFRDLKMVLLPFKLNALIDGKWVVNGGPEISIVHMELFK